MVKFSANLTMMFTEYDFMDRFEQAAKSGFKAVEYMFPYPYTKEEIAEKLKIYGLKQVLFNLPAGNWDKGERGVAVIPGREEEFQQGVKKAIEYAKALDVPRINCLAGLTPKDIPYEKIKKTLVENLRYAAEILKKENIRLLVEAINIFDIPNFFLSKTKDVLNILDEVAHPNLFIMYDVYHMQIMEGNLTSTIKKYIDKIEHIQIADVPGRHEPGTGEINYPNLFKFIEEAGYTGFIGCEYRPLGRTEEGLGWIKPYI